MHQDGRSCVVHIRISMLQLLEYVGQLQPWNVWWYLGSGSCPFYILGWVCILPPLSKYILLETQFCHCGAHNRIRTPEVANGCPVPSRSSKNSKGNQKTHTMGNGKLLKGMRHTFITHMTRCLTDLGAVTLARYMPDVLCLLDVLNMTSLSSPCQGTELNYNNNTPLVQASHFGVL